MNNQESLNDQYWDDLSLPDQDMAWEDMKSRLDERKSRRILFFPFSFAGCALLTGMAAIAGLTGWFLLHGSHAPSPSTAIVRNTAPVVGPAASRGDASASPTVDVSSTGGVMPSLQPSAPTDQVTLNVSASPATITPSHSAISTAHNTLSHTQPGKDNASVTGRDKRGEASAETTSPAALETTRETTPIETTPKTAPVADSVKKKDSVQSVVIKQPEKKQHYHLSAGLGATQQISIKGQEQVRYNTLGKENVFSDYTPSVYFKLERNNRWFVMLEGRLNAPQAVKSFAFAQKTSGNPSNYHLTVNERVLRKTFYHQIPVSFNYYVAPGLSIGAGMVYQQFHAAVWESRSTETDLPTGLVTRSSDIQVMKGYRDSFLYKTQLQSLLQVNYQWHRWMLGLRYTYDLQPYIRFTKPDGDIVEEKNSGLLFQLRFRLFDKGL